MTKVAGSFRTKMIGFVGLSMLLSGVITFILFKGLQYYYHTTARYGGLLAQIRSFMNSLGDIYFFLLIFIPLSILFFFYLTKPYADYFREISKGIHHLAQGDFQQQIHIHTNDEFRDIAEDINLAGKNLQEAIARGDFSENSKNQLVVNLAHDLRTPLTSVLGYLDLILKDENLTQEQVNHFLMIAYTKSQRLEKLIDELFEITRMNYGMIPLKRASINLSDLLIQLNEELYPVFEQKQLSTRLKLASQMPILADGEHLARVFENLLINASRYGVDGKYIDIHGFIDSGEAAVQVVNYGDRISPEDLPHIFDLSFTGEKSRTHQENSTGLGLFIAKNIVEQHNGTISVESTIIRTTFEVRLPLETRSERLE